MSETWPAYDIQILDQARIFDGAGNVVYEPPSHVAVVRVRTELEAFLAVPKKLIAPDHRPDKIRRYVVDGLHHRIDLAGDQVEPTDPEPAPEPDDEPADRHIGPLDNDDDARYLDPVDPRRREAEQRRGRSFDDDDQERDS